MAITLGDSHNASNLNATNTLVLTVPTCVVGDVLIAMINIVHYNSDVTVTDPAGWTLIHTEKVTNYVENRTFYRVVDGTEGASYTWTVSANRRMLGVMTAYKGVDVATPVDAHGAGQGSGTEQTAPTITTTVDNCYLIAFDAVGNAPEVDIPPAGMTLRWSFSTTGSIFQYDEVLSAAGATGTRHLHVLSGYRWAFINIALRPGGGDPYYLGKNRWGHLKSAVVKHTIGA